MGIKEEIGNKLISDFKKKMGGEIQKYLDKEIEESLKLRNKGKWVAGIKKYIDAHQEAYWLLKEIPGNYYGVDGKEYLYDLIGNGVACGPRSVPSRHGLDYIARDPHIYSMVFLLGIGSCANKEYYWKKLNDDNVESILFKNDSKSLESTLDAQRQYWIGGEWVPNVLINRALRQNEELTLKILEFTAPKYYKYVYNKVEARKKVESLQKRVESKGLSLVDVNEITNSIEELRSKYDVRGLQEKIERTRR